MNGAVIIDREELRRRLVDTLVVGGKIVGVNKSRLVSTGLWESVVFYSSSDAPTVRDRVMEVLLRVNPRCIVCGHRTARDRDRVGVREVFGFCQCCSTKCTKISKRGKPLSFNRGTPDDRVIPVHPVYGTDWIKAYQDAVRNDTVSEYEKAYVDALREAQVSYSRRYYTSHNASLLADKKIYYASHKELLKDGLQKYRDAHKEKHSAYMKMYWANHLDVCVAANAKRRSAELNAVPPWLDHDTRLEIRRIYSVAHEMSKQRKVKYHVDHIIPLQGDTVCGLHVPWNLQIVTASENSIKNNKLLSLGEIDECVEHMKTIMSVSV